MTVRYVNKNVCTQMLFNHGSDWFSPVLDREGREKRLIKLVVFFQAEAGIRDHWVTGVQTCALPIYSCGRGQGRGADDPVVGIEGQHTFVNPNDRIIGAPALTATAGVNVKLLPHVAFSPEVRYFTRQAAFDAGSGNYIYVDDQFYVDAGVKWDHVMGKDVDLRLSSQNIFNN